MNEFDLSELANCHCSPGYFIEKYFKVINPIRGLTNYKLTDRQEFFLDQMKNNTFVLDKVDDRQIGVSTIFAAYILWKALFEHDSKILAVAGRYTEVAHLHSIINIGYENLPAFLKVKRTVSNKRNIEFENGSEIVFSNSNPENMQGRSFSFVVLDTFEYFKEGTQKEYINIGANQKYKVAALS
jgi:hypothetical protein